VSPLRPWPPTSTLRHAWPRFPASTLRHARPRRPGTRRRATRSPASRCRQRCATRGPGVRSLYGRQAGLPEETSSWSGCLHQSHSTGHRSGSCSWSRRPTIASWCSSHYPGGKLAWHAYAQQVWFSGSRSVSDRVAVTYSTELLCSSC